MVLCLFSEALSSKFEWSQFIILIIVIIVNIFFFHLQDVKDMVNFKTVSSQTKTILTLARKKICV